MATINPNFSKLKAGYLFPEIGRRTREFLAENPGVEVLRLGIGDTGKPLPSSVVAGLHEAVDKLSDPSTRGGYGANSLGDSALRDAISERYARFGAQVEADEVCVNDGAKPDAANIQQIFGMDNVVAVQDPAYPVYVDSNVIAGRTGTGDNGRYEGLVYMPCTEENGFFPDVPGGKVDLIYLCSPSNPTGTAATHDQLKPFVEYARQHKAVIIFDSAYAAFISDPSLPRSIYEVEGARECAIELNSFSKEAGFTGIRLGWTIVPEALVCEDSEPGQLRQMWIRRQNTMFNGASNIVQAGGLAALTEAGRKECAEPIAYYMENASIIRAGLEAIGLTVFGGVNAPYIWAKTPEGMPSWEFFDRLLADCHVVVTPGAGFGSNGEGYVRLSAFGDRATVEQAVASIRENLSL